MMMFQAKRLLFYAVGILLFFAPFALYQKVLLRLLPGKISEDIHSFCVRIPLQNLFTGKGLEILSVGAISVLLLLVSGFLLGALFCGRFCAAGALPEYLSRLVPDRFKIDLGKVVDPVPIRYGFFAGYLITPFLAGSIACAFCNLSFMQRLLNFGAGGDIGVLGSTAILTGFLWIVLFGLFTKGGRGYCNLLCPIGAFAGFVQSIGSRFRFTFKLRRAREQCSNCGACVRSCPMGSLRQDGKELHYQIHSCITCRQCEQVCPSGALSYGTGPSGWVRGRVEGSEPLGSPPEMVP